MSKFKTFIRNNDTILLFFISLIFLIIATAGIVNRESIIKGLTLSYYKKEYPEIAMTIIGLLIMGGGAIVLPIYSVYRWIRYKNTGKW